MDAALTTRPAKADATMRRLLINWPKQHPQPQRIHLYVEAHRLSLWEI